MTDIAAHYFDGKTSLANTVFVRVEQDILTLVGGNGQVVRSAPLATLRVSEPARHAVRIITFSDGAHCEVADRSALIALLGETGHRDGWVVRVQESWRGVLLSLGLLVIVMIVGYIYGLPLAAQYLARQIPESLEQDLGTHVLQGLDAHALRPSHLDAPAQARVSAAFTALHLPLQPQLLFRHSPLLGANAITLPGGIIVVTDDLVHLLANDAELQGVLAHEAGHAANHHVVQQMIQSSIVGAVLAYLFGDLSSVLIAMPATALEMHYARNHERAADQYAAQALLAIGRHPSALADALAQLEAASRHKADAEDNLGFLRTHPVTAERIAWLRAFDSAARAPEQNAKP